MGDYEGIIDDCKRVKTSLGEVVRELVFHLHNAFF